MSRRDQRPEADESGSRRLATFRVLGRFLSGGREGELHSAIMGLPTRQTCSLGGNFAGNDTHCEHAED